MESSKWIAMAASILIQCSCGASYAFGIYSPLLKSTQGYDQSTLDTVSVFKDIGANVGVLSGLLYASVVAGNSQGPWVVFFTGAIQCFAGYIFIWLAVTGTIARPPVPLTCFFMFVAAHAQTFFNTGNVVTAVQNFPQYGGTVVGILKGFLGLSGAITVQIYRTLFEGDPCALILMFALLPTLLCLLLMCYVRVCPTTAGNEEKYLNYFSLVSVIVASFLMFLIIFGSIFALPLWTRIITLVVLLLLLASPIRIAINAQREDLQRLSHASSTSKAPLIDNEAAEYEKFSAAEDTVENHERPADAGQENANGHNKKLLVGEEMNLLQAMSTMNFWLLFIAMVCGMGSGLATINNISQIGESLNYPRVEVSTLVSLLSIWNFIGRFGAGYVSDVLLYTRGWARPLFMTLTLATMAAGHIVIASGFYKNLYVGSIVVGICYGSQWSLMPTITSEIFGVLHMGSIFNTIAAASPVGSYIFSVRVIGYIYDKEAGGKDACFGTQCFMLSYFIMASVALVGFLVSLILFFRTRTFYRKVFFRRLQRSSLH